MYYYLVIISAARIDAEDQPDSYYLCITSVFTYLMSRFLNDLLVLFFQLLKLSLSVWYAFISIFYLVQTI